MMKSRTSRLVLATALGSMILAAAAHAGPEFKFGPEEQGTLKIDYKGQFQAVARDQGSGQSNDQNTYNFNFRRNRLALMGAYGDVMSVYVQTEFTEDSNVGTLGVSNGDLGSSFQLLDAVVRFDLNDAFKVNVGKFKYAFSRENLEACEMPLTLDRSLFIRTPWVATRDMGVGVWGNAYKNMFQYRIDAMEGRKAASSDAEPKSNFRYSARAHVSVLDPESDYGYKGTYLGEKKVLTVGASYQLEPNVAYADTVSRDTNKNYRAWTVDGFLEYPLKGIGTPTLSGAYEKLWFNDSYQSLNPDPGVMGLAGEKNGWYMKAGFLLPHLPLQVFGRVERWRFAMLNNIFDQGVDWVSGGANYYLRGQNLKLSAEVSNTNLDKEGTFTGPQGTNLTSRDFNTVTAQLQVIF
jgi:hypothetical protein